MGKVTYTPGLVSIILPAHNAGKYLSSVLASVESQTYTNWELCISLDNCSDESEKILAAHVTSGAMKVRKCNKGSPAGARNEAFSLARGEFLAFLDADDWWEVTKLERCVDHLRTSSADLVWHNEVYYYENTGEQKERKYSELESYYPEMIYLGNRISTSAVVMRNPGIIGEGLFNESKKFWGTEDYLFWLDLARKGWRFSLLKETLGYYRITSSSVSSDLRRHLQNAANVIRHFVKEDDSLTLRHRMMAELAIMRWKAQSVLSARGLR